MPDADRYFLIEAGQRTGPHSVEVLRQKADVHAVMAETPFAVESAPDVWAPLREFPEAAAVLFPVRPHYTFAPRTIESVNATDSTEAPSVQDLLRTNLSHAHAADDHVLAPMPERPNRRRTDYIVLAIAGNALAALAWLLLPASPLTHVPLFSFVVLYNVGIPWILFCVMDRY